MEPQSVHGQGLGGQDANLKQKLKRKVTKMEAAFKAYKKDMAAKKRAFLLLFLPVILQPPLLHVQDLGLLSYVPSKIKPHNPTLGIKSVLHPANPSPVVARTWSATSSRRRTGPFR